MTHITNYIGFDQLIQLIIIAISVVSVHVLDTRMPISLQFPTAEDTRGTIEWIRMEDSLFLPAQALLEHSKDGNYRFI